MKKISRLLFVVLVAAATVEAAVPSKSYLSRLRHVRTIATFPTTGDTGACGIAVVPKSAGKLVRGDILVTTTKNNAGQIGMGTTILQVGQDGSVRTFATLNAAELPITPQNVGLTGALAVTKTGWVIVGSVPTTDGTPGTATAGDLFVLDPNGKVVRAINGAGVNGPWALAIDEKQKNRTAVFVANSLNGNGSAVTNSGEIERIVLETPAWTGSNDNRLRVRSRTLIATGFAQRTDASDLIVGMEGLAFDRRQDRLYVIDAATNEIRFVRQAYKRPSEDVVGGSMFRTGGLLNTPEAVVVTPNRTVLAINRTNGELVEFSSTRMEMFHTTLAGATGGVCGLAIRPAKRGIYFIDQAANQLRLMY